MTPPESPNESIALLIDADNAPAARIDFIIAELATYGVVNIRRAYGNWKKNELISWEKVLHEYAIQPVQHFDITKGKNATDMALVIDAMDILYTKNVGTFCLVSSDCDFTPLILRLRTDGKKVIGFGAQKTPSPFVNSCTRFLFLDDPEKIRSAKKDTASTASQLKQDTKLMTVLRNAVEAAADEDGWARLGPVGSHISNQGSFDSRNYGFSKLSDLFSAIDLFEVEKTRKNNVTVYAVRNRRRGRGAD
ncbi:MAG: NYN domain-containing protein [Opitutaceae bacterium]